MGWLAQIEVMLAGLDAPAALLDERGLVVRSNRALLELIGATGGVDGVDVPLWRRLGDGDGRSPLACGFRRALRSDQATVGTARATRPDGPSVCWKLVRLGADGERPLVVAVGSIREEQRVPAREHAALFRVALAIASGTNPVAVFLLVAEEAARLLNAEIGSIARFESATELVNLAAWRTGGEASMLPPYGVRQPIIRGSATERVARTGRPARVSGYDRTDGQIATILSRAGARTGASAPVYTRGQLWGCVSVATTGSRPLGPDAERLLAEFAQLVTVALENAEIRERLVIEATTDSLTGLPNHRALQERLRASVAHAHRMGGQLALVLLDVDSFKTINDTYGHQVGDAVLVDVAARLRSTVRSGELVARLGGDEFALLMPDADAVQAQALATRAIAGIRGTAMGEVGRLTCSAGVCDLEHATDADEIYRFADGALYWAKEHGRDQVCVYASEVVTDLSAQERAEHLSRLQARSALLALARAVDAKDPSTQRHSERVAELAARLSVELGWSSEATARLRQAALVHDVGKIGIPDAMLVKSDDLTEREYEIVQQHAELGARITQDVLDHDQVAWIRHHHERWNGSGYPDGLDGDGIPVGAQLLAVADAYDTMTSDRPYRRAMTASRALEEAQRVAGTQFSPKVVAALRRLIEADEAAM